KIVVFGILIVLLLQRTREGVGPWLARLLPTRAAPPVPPGKRLPARAKSTEPSLLAVEHARKEFGGLVAVDDLSFEVRASEILGLIGPNGAGKSTMFNLISGALPLSRGTVRFAGRPISGLDAHAIARRGLARTFQHVRLLPAMSVLDNVALGAYLRTHAASAPCALQLGR